MPDLKNLTAPAALAGSLASLAFSPAGVQAAPRKDSRPNIIVIMTDQQTARAMSCAGNPDLKTPAMDGLAADGVLFTRAYCAYPLSGPSRASLITGRMPFEVGAGDNDNRPSKEDLDAGIGHRMNEAGYECLYAGKWHVPEVNLPATGTGFRGISPMNDPTLPDACAVALREYDGSKPLLLVASLLDPHEICEYGRFESMHYGEIPAFETADCPNLPANFMPSTYQSEALTLEHDASPRYHNTATYTQDDWRRYLYAYYRLTERVDREIGRLVTILKERGLYDNSVIIFTSDHGDGAAAHRWNQKWALFEECINIPLIVKAPKGKGPAGVRNEQAVSNIGLDLYVTLCDYAGVKLDTERYRGKSWRPVAEGRQQQLHDDIVVETLLSGVGIRGWSVVGPRYKYVLYQWGRNREMLYDLQSDLGEMVNLAVDKRYAAELTRLRTQLHAWSLRVGEQRLTRNLAPYAGNNQNK